MRLYAIAVKGFVFAVFATLTLVPSVWADDSTIYVTLCGSGSSSAITVASPPSDTVVDHATVDLTGTVSGSTQIEVKVDGVYDSTIPLGVGQTNFSSSVMLSVGTHTVLLTANDICGGTDASVQLVITYEPQSVPSSGSTTPTKTDPSSSGDDAYSGGGVTINSGDGGLGGGVFISPAENVENDDRLFADKLILNDGLSGKEIFTLVSAALVVASGIYLGFIGWRRHKRKN